MAMTFTSISDPIGIEEGSFTVGFKASGTIKAGQAVCCSGTTEAVRPAQNDSQTTDAGAYVGVAEYDASHGDWLSVYIPGNKVRTRISGSAKAGDKLKTVSNGFFMSAAALSGGVNGIALEDGTNTAIKALI